MKRLMRIASALFAAATVGTWVVFGMNTGWTKDSVQEKRIDAVTGIEQIVWTGKWVPGVDFLAAGLACSAGLLIGSSAVRAKKRD